MGTTAGIVKNLVGKAFILPAELSMAIVKVVDKMNKVLAAVTANGPLDPVTQGRIHDIDAILKAISASTTGGANVPSNGVTASVTAKHIDDSIVKFFEQLPDEAKDYAKGQCYQWLYAQGFTISKVNAELTNWQRKLNGKSTP